MQQHTGHKRKDINEVNMLVRWGIAVGIAFFGILIYLIWLVQFDIFRNPHIVTDTHLRLALLVLAVYLTFSVVNLFIKYLAQHLNQKYQARFNLIDDVNTYAESMEKVFFKEKKYDHVVLLLHGFSASPQEFQTIVPYLKANNINYYIPNILGFGIDNTILLNKTKRNDWYRTCLGMYDALSNISNNVSIVGHSMGSLLATYIAKHRKVHHLILTGPGFYSAAEDLKFKTILTTPIISGFFSWLVPYLPKPIRKGRKTTSDTLDNTLTNNIFQYLAIPVNSVREAFMMQNEVHPEQTHCSSLSIIYGKHELTINIDKLFKRLNFYHTKYQAYCMENSAHNVFEDYDRETCCELINNILQGKKT